MASMRARHVVVGERPVRERPVQLGPGGELVGIMAAPEGTDDPTQPADERAVVIFLNAGVIHRVGPHRLHVILARRLAERGVTSLRLDLSGLGDSRPLPGTLSFRDSAVADVRAAMDGLEAALGPRRFVLFGLCSGADNALATAAVDPRVTGLVVLDPPAYVTSRSRARDLLARVRKVGGARAAAAWGARVVARRVRAGFARTGLIRTGLATGATDDGYTGGRELPPPDVFHAQLHGLLGRGVEILAVFSGALGDRYNAPDQLFELFPDLRGKIDRAYFPAANHMFTELAAQAELASTVIAWIMGRRR
jgi:pimeloyl-ACP methyl ester carboxylesterase